MISLKYITYELWKYKKGRKLVSFLLKMYAAHLSSIFLHFATLAIKHRCEILLQTYVERTDYVLV